MRHLVHIRIGTASMMCISLWDQLARASHSLSILEAQYQASYRRAAHLLRPTQQLVSRRVFRRNEKNDSHVHLPQSRNKAEEREHHGML